MLSPTGKIGLCSSALVCDVTQRRAVLSYFGVLPVAVAYAAAHVGFSGAQVDGSGAQLVEREHLVVCMQHSGKRHSGKTRRSTMACAHHFEGAHAPCGAAKHTDDMRKRDYGLV